MILLAFDGLGEMVVYASGSESCIRGLTGIEFHRQRFLKRPKQDTSC